MAVEETIRTPVGPSTKAYLAWADAHPMKSYVADPCERLLALNSKAMQETVEESTRHGRVASTRMILLGVIGGAGGLIGGFGVAWG